MANSVLYPMKGYRKKRAYIKKHSKFYKGAEQNAEMEEL
jgi:hypothetical protein